jgi:hypothetical protein
MVLALALAAILALGAPPARAGRLAPSAAGPVTTYMDAPNVPLGSQVKVSPTLIATTAAPGTLVRTAPLVIHNRHAKTITFTLVVDGLTGSSNPDRRVNLLDPATSRDLGATAAPWVTIGATSVTLQPREVATVPVLVSIPADARPGGHYAAVAVVSKGVFGGRAGASVGVLSEVAIPLLITVPGPAKVAVAVRNVRAPEWRWARQDWPLQLDLADTGDLHIQPRGTVTVTSIFGGTAARLPLAGRLLLPGGSSHAGVTWRGVPWFGYYTVKVRVWANGPASPSTTVTRTLWVLPPWWILLVLALLVATALEVRRRRRRWHRLLDAMDDDDGIDTYV